MKTDKTLLDESISSLRQKMAIQNLAYHALCFDGSVVMEFADDDDFCLTVTDLRGIAQHFGVAEDDVFVNAMSGDRVRVEIVRDCRPLLRAVPPVPPISDAELVSPHTVVIDL